MAKAGDKNSIDWIPLGEARKLIVEVYGSPQRSGELLIQWLGEGRVAWCCKLLEGGRTPEEATALTRETPPGGLVIFWADRVYDVGGTAFWRANLEINWEENSAREMYWGGGTSAYGITVPRADVLAQLPKEPNAQNEVSSGATKTWIAAEFKRMKPDEIPLRISDFARELAKRMRKAAKTDSSVHPVTWQHIKNQLPGWGLWPISSIK
jgi:hypothetical protein